MNMIITLEDLAKSEHICKLAEAEGFPLYYNREHTSIDIQAHEPDNSVGVDGREPILISRPGVPVEVIGITMEFVENASTILPAVLRLARELYEGVKILSEYPCPPALKAITGCGNCPPCQARQIVERMEGSNGETESQN